MRTLEEKAQYCLKCLFEGGERMFTVIEKGTGREFTVYGMNGPTFLIYDDIEGCWFYRHINDFVPANKGEKETR